MCKSAHLEQDEFHLVEVPEYEKIPNTEVASREFAEANGLLVVTPKENELFIDIDGRYAFEFFLKQIERYQKFEHVVYSWTPSKSGLPYRHVVVTLPRPITSIERIFLQALLGSDRGATLFSYIKERNGDANPVMFFEKPEVVK